EAARRAIRIAAKCGLFRTSETMLPGRGIGRGLTGEAGGIVNRPRQRRGGSGERVRSVGQILLDAPSQRHQRKAIELRQSVARNAGLTCSDRGHKRRSWSL